LIGSVGNKTFTSRSRHDHLLCLGCGGSRTRSRREIEPNGKRHHQPASPSTVQPTSKAAHFLVITEKLCRPVSAANGDLAAGCDKAQTGGADHVQFVSWPRASRRLFSPSRVGRRRCSKKAVFEFASKPWMNVVGWRVEPTDAGNKAGA
jgi:hypothetical protein